MKIITKTFALLAVILLIGLSGCTDTNTTRPDKNNSDVDDNTHQTDTNLTETDWDYFVFHHVTGEDLHDLFGLGFDIINSELSYYDPVNSTFYLELSKSNQHKLHNLYNISKEMNENISNYRSILKNFTVSSTIQEHKDLHQSLLDNYKNISNAFFSIYKKINRTIDLTGNSTKLFDISSEMQYILIADDVNTDILDAQIQIIVNIPDAQWDAWTEGRDWSFMGGEP